MAGKAEDVERALVALSKREQERFIQRNIIRHIEGALEQQRMLLVDAFKEVLRRENSEHVQCLWGVLERSRIALGEEHKARAALQREVSYHADVALRQIVERVKALERQHRGSQMQSAVTERRNRLVQQALDTGIANPKRKGISKREFRDERDKIRDFIRTVDPTLLKGKGGEMESGMIWSEYLRWRSKQRKCTYQR